MVAKGEYLLRDFLFGSKASGYPLVPGGFSITPSGFRTQDEENPFGAGLMFGVDTPGHATFSWELLIVREGPNKWEEAHRALEEIHAIWRSAEQHNEPGRMLTLYWYHGSEERAAYGRPRRFAADRTKLRQGVAIVTCDFTAVDDLAYSKTVSSSILNMVPQTTGGLEAPIVAPITAYGTESTREGFITVGGDASTPARIIFRGPVTNPWLRLTGKWEVGLTMTIPQGEYVEVDALWNTVRLNGSQSRAGSLTRQTPRLVDLRLPVGGHELQFGGTDHTGLARAEVYWREATFAI